MGDDELDGSNNGDGGICSSGKFVVGGGDDWMGDDELDGSNDDGDDNCGSDKFVVGGSDD